MDPASLRILDQVASFPEGVFVVVDGFVVVEGFVVVGGFVAVGGFVVVVTNVEGLVESTPCRLWFAPLFPLPLEDTVTAGTG